MSTRMLLADVARAAGVSVATASRALSGRGELRAETRARVQEAAARLGYTPGGRGSRKPPARHIDLVLRTFDGRWAGEVTAEVRAAAAVRGLDLVLTEERDLRDDDWPTRIAERGSRGVVLGVIRPTVAQLAEMREAGVAVVLFESGSDDTRGLPSVRAADTEGGAAAAEHLVARGAERFAIALPTPAYRYGRARSAGFTARLRELRPDIEPALVRTGSDAAAAREALRALLASTDGGRLGVFAGTDELAVQVYRVAHDLGARIPRDVLVIGFDDVPGSSFMVPPLTTVHQPIRRMADRALELLLHPTGAGPEAVLPATLVVRGST